MKKTLKQKAFTLAETLIVMGVIGVVAALTIPSLSNSTNDKDTVTRLRKVHAALEDAFGRMIATNGEFETWGENLGSNNLGERLVKPMKITKNCKITTTEKCFGGTSMKDFKVDGTDGNELNANASVYKFIMADGASVALDVSSATCTSAASGTTTQDLKEVCGTATVDVDGPGSGKHAYGADMFTFYITKKGFYPVGTDGDTGFKYADDCTKKGSPAVGGVTSKGCTAWVVYNGNMDYKKSNSDGNCITNTSKTLDFSTNTSCD